MNPLLVQVMRCTGGLVVVVRVVVVVVVVAVVVVVVETVVLVNVSLIGVAFAPSAHLVDLLPSYDGPANVAPDDTEAGARLPP